MGLISKLKGKDKHEKEEDTSASAPVATNSPNKSYYTGPQSDATPAGYGQDSTPSAPTGPPATNTSSGSHGHTDNYKNGPTTHGALSESLSGDRHGTSSSDRYDNGPSGGLGSHGQLNETMAGGGRHGHTSSSDYNNTPGAFPGSDSGLGHSSGRPAHVDRDGYGQSGLGHDQDRYGGSTSSGPGYGSGQNFSGRDTYGSARDAPGPYGTRDDYAGSRGPAPHTLGPHQSDVANVLDPRARPEPEHMKNHRTVGPHQSDTLNRADPRVTADPRAHNLPRDPHDAPGYDSRDLRDGRYDSRDAGRQTGGFVGGPHERLENHGSIPTAGGAKVGGVGAGANDPYDDYSRGGMGRDVRGNDPYASSNDRFGPGPGAGFGDRNDGPRGTQGGSTGLPEQRKMGGAFEAGYQTAMEHAKQEQQRF
ncbi:hypothetical protein Q7P37_007309 [Cladosporium fusiforme]